jgi:hypothetical protein
MSKTSPSAMLKGDLLRSFITALILPIAVTFPVPGALGRRIFRRLELPEIFLGDVRCIPDR